MLWRPSSHVYALPPSIESRTVPLIQVLTTVLHAQRRAGLDYPRRAAWRNVIGRRHRSRRVRAIARTARESPRGAMVIGISRSAWKRRLAEQLGVDRTAPPTMLIASVKAATGGRGADVVVESTGAVASIADAIAMVRPGGTIVLFGIYTASEAALPFYQLYYKEPADHQRTRGHARGLPRIDRTGRQRTRRDCRPWSRTCCRFGAAPGTGDAGARHRRPDEDYSGELTGALGLGCSDSERRRTTKARRTQRPRA